MVGGKLGINEEILDVWLSSGGNMKFGLCVEGKGKSKKRRGNVGLFFKKIDFFCKIFLTFLKRQETSINLKMNPFRFS